MTSVAPSDWYNFACFLMFCIKLPSRLSFFMYFCIVGGAGVLRVPGDDQSAYEKGCKQMS